MPHSIVAFITFPFEINASEFNPGGATLLGFFLDLMDLNIFNPEVQSSQEEVAGNKRINIQNSEI